MSRFIVKLAILVLFLITAQTYAYAENQEVLVKYRGDVQVFSDGDLPDGVIAAEVIAPQIELLTLADGIDMQTMLSENADIEYIEPNYERHLLTAIDASGKLPNDPHLKNQWWLQHVKAPQLWRYQREQQKAIVVAVIDTGIDKAHEDLRNRLSIDGYDFYNKTAEMKDTHGHGTQVAGVIAAEANNARGISGLVGQYDVSILPLKVLGDNGKGKSSAIIEAINYAIAKRVDVVNLSLGGASYSAIENEVIQRAIDAGIIVIAAIGNEAEKGNPINYPAAYNNVIAVGAVNERNEKSYFSNFNQYVQLVAPGENIWTTLPKNTYNTVKGTSFSAPIVSGTAAMLKALMPQLTSSEIQQMLTSSATDLGKPGRDDEYGAGLVNIERLVDDLAMRGMLMDFPAKRVTRTHAFTVTFSQDLQVGKDYQASIVLSKQPDGREEVQSFQVEVNKEAPHELLITPTTEWEKGEYYLTVAKNTVDKRNRMLEKNVRMRFVVE